MHRKNSGFTLVELLIVIAIISVLAGLVIPATLYARQRAFVAQTEILISSLAISVTEYREAGYLPEAMINFLARMGWSYDDKQEIFSREELIEKFTLEGISRSGAVYDLKKLENLGGHYIRQRPLGEIVDLAVPYLKEKGWLADGEVEARRGEIERMVADEKERIDRLGQIVEKLGYYFEEPGELDPKARKVLRKRDDTAELIDRYRGVLEGEFSSDPAALEESARRFVEDGGGKLGELAQPLRVILTGRTATPPLFSVMASLGKETCLRRLGGAGELIRKAREMPS